MCFVIVIFKEERKYSNDNEIHNQRSEATPWNEMSLKLTLFRIKVSLNLKYVFKFVWVSSYYNS